MYNFSLKTEKKEEEMSY